MNYTKYPQTLRIGFTGEQNARTPQIDVSELLNELPGASVALLFRRPREAVSYPVASSVDSNGVLTWTVSGGDVLYPGSGFAQALLTLTENTTEKRLLGPVIAVTVLPSIANMTEEPPGDYDSWIAALLEAAGGGHNVVDVSLTVEGWDSNLTQTVNVTWMPANAIIIVNPAAASISNYLNAGVRATAHADGSITFTADETPSAALSVGILWIKPA